MWTWGPTAFLPCLSWFWLLLWFHIVTMLLLYLHALFLVHVPSYWLPLLFHVYWCSQPFLDHCCLSWWYGWWYTLTLAIGYSFLDSLTWGSFESCSSLDSYSFLCPSWGLSSCGFVAFFSFDSSSNSSFDVSAGAAKSSSFASLGPLFLEISCIVIFFFLVPKFQKLLLHFNINCTN